MEKTTSNPNLLAKFYCNVFGHDYEVSKKVTSHVKEYTCSHCKKQLTTNENGRLTELTPMYREINSVLERIYTNKMLRLRENRLYQNAAYKITA